MTRRRKIMWIAVLAAIFAIPFALASASGADAATSKITIDKTHVVVTPDGKTVSVPITSTFHKPVIVVLSVQENPYGPHSQGSCSAAPGTCTPFSSGPLKVRPGTHDYLVALPGCTAQVDFKLNGRLIGAFHVGGDKCGTSTSTTTSTTSTSPSTSTSTTSTSTTTTTSSSSSTTTPGSTPSSSVTSSGSGELPKTGFDLVSYGGLITALVLAGFFLLAFVPKRARVRVRRH